MEKFEGYLLGSDFDGTLIRGGVVTEEDKNAIRRFRAEGGKFGVVTGRYYRELDQVYQNIGDDFDFMIYETGSACRDAKGTLLFEHSADSKLLIPLAEYAKAQKFAFLGCTVGTEWFNLNLSDQPDESKSALAEVLARGVFHHAHAIIGEIPRAQVARDLEARLGGSLNVFFHSDSFDVTPAGVSKATAVHDVADRLGIPEKNIYTVGDSPNDIAMLLPYHGLAVEGAEDEVKEAAEKVVCSIAAVIDYIAETRNLCAR